MSSNWIFVHTDVGKGVNIWRDRDNKTYYTAFTETASNFICFNDNTACKAALCCTEQCVINTRIYHPIITGDLDGVKTCVAAGSNIHVCSDKPLYLALSLGKMDIAQYLLSQGAEFQTSWMKTV